MEKLSRQSRILLENIRSFQFSDLIGLGRILEINEDQEFDDFLTDLVVRFEEQSWKRRKEILKFVKDIKIANENMTTDPNLLLKVKEKSLKPLEIREDDVGPIAPCEVGRLLKQKK